MDRSAPKLARPSMASFQVSSFCDSHTLDRKRRGDQNRLNCERWYFCPNKMTGSAMSMKSLPRAVWIVPAILLAIAVARLPYGYYTFTRIVTCGVAVLIAIVEFKEHPTNRAWS